jgi:hypothetical protein
MDIEDITEFDVGTPVAVSIDTTAIAIKIELVGPWGLGFAATLDCDEAIDLALRLIGTVARLRGWDAGDA